VALRRLGIYLPRLYPPKAPIPLPGGVVHEVTDDEIESEFGENLGGEGVMTYEYAILRKRLRRRGSGDDRRVVYERNGPGPTDESFVALLDLVSGDWRHRFHVPMPTKWIRGATMPRAIRMRHLTPQFAVRLRAGMEFLVKTRRLEIALHRWGASYKRGNALESVLDCCAALEAVINTESELRLRLALSVGELVARGKEHSRRMVYRLYGVRNKFVHGAALPSVPSTDAEALVAVTAAVLNGIIRTRKLPAPLEEARLLAV